jgi:hypothetical protein
VKAPAVAVLAATGAAAITGAVVAPMAGMGGAGAVPPPMRAGEAVRRERKRK